MIERPYTAGEARFVLFLSHRRSCTVNHFLTEIAERRGNFGGWWSGGTEFHPIASSLFRRAFALYGRVALQYGSYGPSPTGRAAATVVSAGPGGGASGEGVAAGLDERSSVQ